MTFRGRIEALITVPTGGAAVAATDGSGGPTAATIAAGSYYLTAAGGVSSIITAFQAALNAAMTDAWTVSISTTTGLVTIDCPGETWSLTWTSTTLRDLLGFTGNFAGVSAAQTGTKQARGLWFPDCPLYLDGDPSQAPEATDLKQSESPQGKVLALVGNVKYRHIGLRYQAVPKAQTWESAATYDHGSWQYFLRETQLHLGSSWFTPSSLVQIYWSDAGVDALVGVEANSGVGVAGWQIKGINSVNPPLTVPGYTGLWRVEIPEIVSEG